MLDCACSRGVAQAHRPKVALSSSRSPPLVGGNAAATSTRLYSDRMGAGGAIGETLRLQQASGVVDGKRPHVVLGVVFGAAVVAAALGAPVVWLVASLVAVAIALGQSLRACVDWLPAAAVLLLTTTMVAPLAAGVTGADVFDGSAVPRGLLVLGVAAAVAWAWRLGSEELRPRVRSGSELSLLLAPAALMLVLFVAMVTSGTARLSWFLSGDHLRHLGLTTRTVESGALEYGMLSYPHGWHALMAAMWRTTGSQRDGVGLLELVQMQAAATWMVLVLITLSLSLTASSLAGAGGLGPRLSGLAGFTAGAMVLSPAFFGAYVPRGFDTTLVVLLAISAAVHVASISSASASALATAVGATVVAAHSWQVLLVPTGLLTAVVLWQRHRSVQSQATRLADVMTIGAGALVSLPGVLAAMRGFGMEAAAEAGDVPPPVIGWSIVVVIAVTLVGKRGPGWPVATLAVAAAGTFLTSALLAAIAGVGLSSYYPSKTLWVAAVIGLPAVGVLAALLLSVLEGSSIRKRVGFVLVGVVVGLGLAVSLATPTTGVLRSSWGGADPEQVMRMTTSAPSPRVAVIWRASNTVDDATAQLLLDFYSATAQTPRLGLAARSVSDQCALLLAAPRPVVLSDAPETDVRNRFTCAPGLRVVPMSEIP